MAYPQDADWADFKVFLAVAEFGSLSAAARKLGLSQPTITRRLQELEGRLGAALIVRRSNGVALTEAGDAVLQHAQRMRESADAIVAFARERDQRAQGHVRIRAPDGLAGFWLAPRLRAFQDAHPQISLTFDVGLWRGHAVQDDLEITLTYETPTAPQTGARVLAVTHYGFFGTKEYLKAHGAPTSPQDLAKHRVIRHAAQNHQPETWAAGIAGQTADFAQFTLETNSSTAALTAVRAHAGVAMLPTYLASDMPDLLMLNDAALASPRLWLVYDREALKVARVARVIEWLEEIFDPEANPWFAEKFVHPKHFPARPARAY